jgi:DNA-directed RNA polymerase subunit K/omega
MILKEDFLPIDVLKLGDLSGNVYRSITIVGKRANQITRETKEELSKKLAEFAPAYDNLEEVTENKEQIEISRHYEKKPKATQVALEEFMRGEVYWRDPNVEQL